MRAHTLGMPLLLLALAVPALAQEAVPVELPGTPEAPAPVRVEKSKPMRDRHPTLRFLRENRDFIRARYDRLRERPLEVRGESAPMDPRYLRYAEMLAQLAAERDSLARTEDARNRRELFASIGQLGELEAQLDQMEAALAAQRGRLARLEGDFTGDQRTELIVVVSGASEAAAVTEIRLELEDGGVLALPLDDARRQALEQGGMVELFHGFLEPREQNVRVGLTGPAWSEETSGYLQIHPARDRLNFLRLDLSTLTPGDGAAALRAGVWVQAATTLSIDG